MIELPCNESHKNESQSDDTWYCNDEGLYLIPDVDINIAPLREDCNSILDLFKLNRTIDEQPEVTDTDHDHLDSVLKTKSIVDQN